VVFKINDTGDIYTLDLKSSDPSVKEGSMDDADLIVECESENMAKLITGQLKPQQAFMKGKLKIKGKMSLAMKLTSVLVATRKKLPVSKL
jgi:3-hydroxyacyl-CoA dehydrogenase/3a,7a,12a-trihydroxy-5b-cholest-24-enoyl-CoA hydratase